MPSSLPRMSPELKMDAYAKIGMNSHLSESEVQETINTYNAVFYLYAKKLLESSRQILTLEEIWLIEWDLFLNGSLEVDTLEDGVAIRMVNSGNSDEQLFMGKLSMN